MKNSVVLLIHLVMLIGLNNYSFAEGSVNWRQESIDVLLKESVATHLPVFLVVKAKWCTNSKIFLNETLKDQTVSSYINKSFIPKLIDEAEDKVLSTKYKVFGFPGILLLSSTGEEIDRIRPYQGQELVDGLKRINQYGKTITELEKLLVKYPHSHKLKETLFFKSARRIDIDRALTYKSRLLIEHPNEYQNIKEKILTELALAYSLNSESQKAITVLKELLNMPNSDKIRVYNLIAIEYFILNDFEAGFTTLREAIDWYPSEPLFFYSFMIASERFGLYISEAIALGEGITMKQVGSNFEQGRLWYSLATLYNKINHICDALGAISRAIVKDPEDAYYPTYRNELLSRDGAGSCKSP